MCLQERCTASRAIRWGFIPDSRLYDEPLDGRLRTGLSDSPACHSLGGFSSECGAREDLPFAHKIDNATHLAPKLADRVYDKASAQALRVVSLLEFLSKCDLHFFNKLFPLRLRKCNDKPCETRQESILIARF